MKYVALLSGGKDSCYNLLHCAKHGHELVAAATLGPEPGKEELDSYLYQTVGQDAIELIAQALEVPLYRQIIKGTAVKQGSHYGDRENFVKGTEGDETEDLLTLLSMVKSKHPDVQGVSVGAILSNYQRVRVEHVCRRLELTSLAYLWQRDQSELLSEMVEAGMSSILIKVAGIGLITEHLGRSLSQMQSTLLKLNALYGLHVCGEGGEYETFTLDCPLFKHRIILIETETVIHSDNAFATVAFLRLKKAVLEKKEKLKSYDMIVPPLLDNPYNQIKELPMPDEYCEQRQLVSVTPKEITYRSSSAVSCRAYGSWICVSNVECDPTLLSQGISIEEEVRECFRIAADHLSQHGHQLSNCVNINIYISTMEQFSSVNSIYGSYFGASPPARACVGVDLPRPIRVRLECIAFKENSSGRQGLHVQGLSYWAPANIGPYSQAILAGETAFVSGQIGLIPCSLTLPSPRSVKMELALASQHLKRIKDALQSISGNNWTGFTQLMIYWLTDPQDISFIRAAHAFLNIQAPSLLVGIKELPKGASVEVQTFLHTGRFVVCSDEDEDEIHNILPEFEEDDSSMTQDYRVHREILRFPGYGVTCVLICIRGEDPDLDRVKGELNTFSSSLLSVRFFYCKGNSTTIATELHGKFPVTCVPCRFIHTCNGAEFDYALCALMMGN